MSGGARDTEADANIRQHTPAYASIRQHTSAYVSIRVSSLLAAGAAIFSVLPLLRACVCVSLNRQLRAATRRKRCLHSQCCSICTVCTSSLLRQYLHFCFSSLLRQRCVAPTCRTRLKLSLSIPWCRVIQRRTQRKVVIALAELLFCVSTSVSCVCVAWVPRCLLCFLRQYVPAILALLHARLRTAPPDEPASPQAPAYVSIRQHTPAYVSIAYYRRTAPPDEPASPQAPAYVSIRQHTSAYASTRQHTSAYSAYVSIAYVSIRGVA